MQNTYELSEMQFTGIDCSAVIKTAIEKRTLYHAEFMKHGRNHQFSGKAGIRANDQIKQF